mmetsp:Transcript_87971/g.249158  ORF Transcript_87971/g.249158 Transcript_87971/m.249158 type:complete len:87 (-) Transcript_87971:8-268(-)
MALACEREAWGCLRGTSSAPGWHAAEPSPGMRAGVLPCQLPKPRCPAGPKTVCKGCTVGPDASDEVGPQDDLKTAREACQLAQNTE